MPLYLGPILVSLSLDSHYPNLGIIPLTLVHPCTLSCLTTSTANKYGTLLVFCLTTLKVHRLDGVPVSYFTLRLV